MSSNNQLASLIERIERLEEEKAGIASDIKDIYAEAKSNGFTPKIMRKIVRERRMDAAKRKEEEALLDTYRSALGMLSDTPLGQAAMEAATR